jgi:hypothetical protein
MSQPTDQQLAQSLETYLGRHAEVDEAKFGGSSPP